MASLGNLDWRTVLRLPGLDEFMTAIGRHVGLLEIFGGSDPRSPDGFSTHRSRCSDASGRMVLLTSSFFRQFGAPQRMPDGSYGPTNDTWSAALMEGGVAVLPEPIMVFRGNKPLVRPYMWCGFDEIVQVCDSPARPPTSKPFLARYPSINIYREG